MKILFSPSETKKEGGESKVISQNNFLFSEHFEKRLEILNKYNDFLKIATKEQLEKLFGTKKDDIINKYKTDIFKSPVLKAIERYEGVAYDYLSYNNLENNAKKYIDENVIIFSNLIGPILAKDEIPDYKLKQSETFENLKIDKFYSDNFSEALDEFLENDDILDLRAGFYEKFYTIKKPYYTMKFMKDNKVISHFAKAYRGEVLKLLAKNQIQTFEQLLDMQIPNLSIVEIKEQKLKKEIVFSIG